MLNSIRKTSQIEAVKIRRTGKHGLALSNLALNSGVLVSKNDKIRKL